MHIAILSVHRFECVAAFLESSGHLRFEGALFVLDEIGQELVMETRCIDPVGRGGLIKHEAEARQQYHRDNT